MPKFLRVSINPAECKNRPNKINAPYAVFRCLIVVAVSILVTDSVFSSELKHPDWHPSGHLLISEGSCAGGIDLYLIDVAKGAVRRVWDGGMTEGYPRWFPNGDQITFHQIDETRQSRIFIASISSDGNISDAHPISNGPFDIEPSPSPFGTAVAFTQQGEKGQDIAVVDLTGSNGNQTWLTESAENFPSWHPINGSIIFHSRDASGTHMYLRDLESDELEVLTMSGGPDFVGHFDSRGDRLAYSSERDGDREVYLYDFNADTDMRLTNRPGRDGYPKISPDGQSIAYHAVMSENATVIRIMNIESGRIVEFSCDDFVRAGSEELRSSFLQPPLNL
jgi:Tol biopolymer transport system component